MEAIFIKDGNYILLNNISDNKKYNLVKDTHLVFSPQSNRDGFLYGGRVLISDNNLLIDGIKIIRFTNDKMAFHIESPGLALTTQYLNQIQQKGIEEFLCEYKTALNEFRDNINAKKKEIESSGKENKETMNNCEEILCEILCIQYDLMMHMDTSISLENITNTYNSFAKIYLK